ncbi:hypothetical protein SSP35_05_02240 [Streptomyces sp. NBRC 110611]|uniref:helix-turn-helix domain-containing protein n=1 Tax=Streptomyces sp. NBRC 110611 TaxID=1621259 RepID=UPI000857CF39|nr:helix-turn-helix transcriptional regulator [Streptomyces sp. NBRC 110611]GAU67657.1 hypothetical protein SSP35_05_02240 [Streptomyces sp. NBRC 110611]
MRRNEQERKNTPEGGLREFARWFSDRLTALGYDVSGPRSGGRGDFAKRAGVSSATVSRIINEVSVPRPDVLAAMAPTLGVSLGELLVRSGWATEEELTRTAPPAEGGRRITAEEAALLLGITDQQRLQLFVTFVTEMQRQEAQNSTDNDR